MVTQRINGLRADILPHRRWAVSRWYYANPIWYYHREGSRGDLVLNRRFYQLVDPDLRPLCQLLNHYGLRTTPSCQGHFYPRDHFERTWEELKREESAIQRLGLVVRDSETDEELLFQDDRYALPWPDFDAFFSEAGGHQGSGYLGVIVPTENEPLHLMLLEAGFAGSRSSIAFDAEMTPLVGGFLHNVMVQGEEPRQRSELWCEITTRIQSSLEALPAAPICAAPGQEPQRTPEPTLQDPLQGSRAAAPGA